MQIILNQTQHIIGDFEQIFQDLKMVLSSRAAKVPEIHLFPELYLTGYPLQDLVLQMGFIERYQTALEDFNLWLEKQEPESKKLALVGGLDYEFDKEGLPLYIRNVIFECQAGKKIKSVYTKHLLPNYDIFDEEKYFCSGTNPSHIEFQGKKIGLLICEDMWFSSTHLVDPVQLLKEHGESIGGLDFVVNLSASPYFLGKQEKREKRGKVLAHQFQAPFYYVNRVGGEDEILFDGQSFMTDGNKVIRSRSFEEDALVCEAVSFSKNEEIKDIDPNKVENSWESLFKADLIYPKNELPELRPWTDQECEEVIKAICFGLQEYATKCGFKKFLVALSGGIDSGLVLHLVKLALKEGQSLEAIYMPSKFSSPLSTELSEKLCKNLDIPLIHFPIKFLHSTINQEFRTHVSSELKGLTDENVQSRLRGAILYTRSNQTGSMVINTSNKSEIAVGYSTLYGDSVGALSLLGDLYKSQVYDLARYLNKTRDLLPIEYVERPPSAELRENQEDSQSLPPYPRLDTILEGFLSYRLSQKNLHELGFDQNEIKKTYDLYTKSEYKRNQFCPIVKVKAKSFGFGYRIPITKKV